VSRPVRLTVAPVVVALAGLLAAVALGANGDPQKKIKPADQARARAIALSRADFGPGWKATRSSTTSSDPRCSYYNPDQSDLVENGHYDSPDFTRPDNSFVSSTVGIFQTSGQARTAYRRLVTPLFSRCLGEIFVKAVQKPNTAKVLSTGRRPFPSYGDRSDAYRVAASFKTPSITVPVIIDVVLINRGRANAGLILVGIGRPLAAGLERTLAGKVAARMR
jgi:hypothetical protein